MRDVAHYLEDMLEAIDRIETYTSGFKCDSLNTPLIYDAVLRNLLVIGEAAKRLPEEFRAQSQIPWRSIAGLRDIIVHDYGGIDTEIISDVLSNHLPVLKAHIQSLLQD